MPCSLVGRADGAPARARRARRPAPRERIWLGALLIGLWTVSPILVVLALVEISEPLEAAPPICLR